jgi:hypothetical protein
MGSAVGRSCPAFAVHSLTKDNGTHGHYNQVVIHWYRASSPTWRQTYRQGLGAAVFFQAGAEFATSHQKVSEILLCRNRKLLGKAGLSSGSQKPGCSVCFGSSLRFSPSRLGRVDNSRGKSGKKAVRSRFRVPHDRKDRLANSRQLPNLAIL